MKKHLINLKSLFLAPKTKSTLLDDLQMKTVTTAYSAGLILGQQREAGVKLWTVAVRTVEPEVVFPTHAAWMLNIKCERALLAEEIGLLKKNEILKDAFLYKTGIKGYRTVKNNKL